MYCGFFLQILSHKLKLICGFKDEVKHELVFGVEPPQISLYFTSKRDVFKVLLSSSSIILKVFQSFFGGGALAPLTISKECLFKPLTLTE